MTALILIATDTPRWAMLAALAAYPNADIARVGALSTRADVRNVVRDFQVPSIVILTPTYEGFFGFSWRPGELGTNTQSIALLAWKAVGRAWIARSLFAGWVLKHEQGHLRGLGHCWKPWCLMASPNVSFGHFCRKCAP